MGRKGEEGRASSLFVHLGLDSLNRSNARAEPYHHCITMFHTGQLGSRWTGDERQRGNPNLSRTTLPRAVFRTCRTYSRMAQVQEDDREGSSKSFSRGP